LVTVTREPAPQAELDAYLQWYFERHPVHADAMGVPGHASRLGDFTAGGYEGHQRDVARWRSRLQAIDDAALSAEARIDRDLVVAVLGGQLLQARWPAWRRDPAEYLDPVFAGLDLPFLHRLAPETERVAAVSSRLGEVPEVLAACRHNLDPGLAAPLLVRRAAAQARAGAAFVTGALPAAVGDDELRATLVHAAGPAAKAFTTTVAFLEEFEGRASGDWRMGEELYSGLLRERELLGFGAGELHEPVSGPGRSSTPSCASSRRGCRAAARTGGPPWTPCRPTTRPRWRRCARSTRPRPRGLGPS